MADRFCTGWISCDQKVKKLHRTHFELDRRYFLFYLFVIQVTVSKRTIRFLAHSTVVNHRVRREMRLAADKSWTRHRLKHVTWRSQWIIVCTLEWTMAVSCEILSCSAESAQGSPLICTERGIPLPGSRTVVLQIFFSRLLMLPSIWPLSGRVHGARHFASMAVSFCPCKIKRDWPNSVPRRNKRKTRLKWHNAML